MSEIQIRDARLEDAAALREIYSYYVTDTAVTFEYEIPSVEEFRQRMSGTMGRYPYLVIEKAGMICGYAYAGSFVGRAAYDWSAEMTIYLDHRMRGGGLGRRLYRALEERLSAMGILNLYACIGYPQEEDDYLTMDSPRFHEKLGYVLAGRFRNCGYKFHHWYDMIWMEKIIGEHQELQPEIRYEERLLQKAGKE